MSPSKSYYTLDVYHPIEDISYQVLTDDTPVYFIGAEEVQDAADEYEAKGYMTLAQPVYPIIQEVK